ncbi:recombination protein RecR [Clostridium sp. CAG:1024]|jgi:recombination protein RecR|nr:recombination mediator RecR [Clostridium sp.]MDY6080644.1 recombination mediator RecR [Eubacteriales bacterium]CCX42123.1 recombination protein RecR [Clostridium sp. CAG:1024]
MVTIEPIEKLTTQLARLPGIGHKTAQRLAYHILGVPEAQALELADAIIAARRDVHDCPICGTYTDVTPCAICADEKRDGSVICVVCDPRDVTAMEKTREFSGKYHVLQGVLSPMDGVGPNDIRINELVERVKKGGVREVILATNPDVEGEATASYIARLLKPMGVACTRIAHGIPIGGNLEYTDEVTLAKALEGRRAIG